MRRAEIAELDADAPFRRRDRRPEAGRLCPMDYRYSPSVLDRAPDFNADTLYVVGGLYGNLAALDAVERLAAAEPGAVTIVFNGDFHWFDADDGWFSEIERRVSSYRALRGNVETEIARGEDIGAGCGCAYPESVDDGTVTRSNAILAALKRTVMKHAGAAEKLGGLPMHAVAAVGPLQIAVVHGDAGSLAGWNFAHDRLDDPQTLGWLAEARRLSRADIFASTHTCLAALRSFRFPAGAMTVINNGAAGMPNFSGLRSGLLSRIATRPSPHPSVFGTMRDGVHIDALALDYDHAAFLNRFLARWPEGSPAHLSYFSRISNGPDYRITQARG